MTQEDQYAIIGKAHEDFKAAKQKMAAIELRGKSMSEAAMNLANAISDPSRILLDEGQGVVVAGVRNPFFFTDEIVRMLSRDNVAQHVKEYKATRQQVAALKQHLLSLGQNPGD
jgi:hypothetical protein